MDAIVSVHDFNNNNEMHFYLDGTFTGVPEGCAVVNAYPFKLRQIQAAISEFIQEGKSLSHFADWFNRTIGVIDSVGASADGLTFKSIKENNIMKKQTLKELRLYIKKSASKSKASFLEAIDKLDHSNPDHLLIRDCLLRAIKNADALLTE